MSPDTNGNPPTAARRKKKINSVKKYVAPDCSCFGSTPMYRENLPNVSYFSVGNDMGSQHLLPTSSNCKNCFFSTNVFKNLPTDLSESPEYSSLPIVNMQSVEEVPNARRFSDPGLPNDSDSSTSTVDESIVQKLKTQVNMLKQNNRKLSKEVEDLRLEVNLLKQQSNFNQYNREYEPGLLADIIREVRDAAKVREDAFFARVKHLMEEQQQQLGLNHMHFLAEKQKNSDRIFKLEEQLKGLNCNRSESSSVSLNSLNGNNSSSARQVLELEREALELRRELQDTRAKKVASDQKLMLLDKKLYSLMRAEEVQSSDASDDGKTESESVTSSGIGITNASLISQNHAKIILSGPVTDL